MLQYSWCFPSFSVVVVEATSVSCPSLPASESLGDMLRSWSYFEYDDESLFQKAHQRYRESVDFSCACWEGVQRPFAKNLMVFNRRLPTLQWQSFLLNTWVAGGLVSSFCYSSVECLAQTTYKSTTKLRKKLSSCFYSFIVCSLLWDTVPVEFFIKIVKERPYWLNVAKI